MEYKNTNEAGVISKRSLNIIAILAFILGCLYYLLCRTPLISILQWLIPRIFELIIAHIRGLSIPLCSSLPIGIQDALPDGLWSFTYATLIANLWFSHGSWVAYFWLGTIPPVCVGYEMLQIGGIIPGSFSWIDLHFSLLGMALGILLVVLPGSIKR